MFITFLPFSDKTEAAKLVDDFILWLRETIEKSPLVSSGRRSLKTCAVTILAGVGEGLPRQDQLNDVVIEALKNQKEVVSINLYGG